MLKNLYIENIAVIEHADISFMDGFIVLSGETGAGKSIIIDSLGAILGGRVSRELIRTGESRAAVTALFDALPEKAALLACELGFEPEDGQLLVRREMTADGRNSCKINGKPASLGILKTLGAVLVGIHGQHDGQQLLNEAVHIEYLDEFGGLGALLDDYLYKYDSLLQLNRRIKAISLSAAEKERLREKLTAQVSELAELNIHPGEQAELNELRARLISSQHIAEGLSLALSALDGADGDSGAQARIAESEIALRSAAKHGGAAEGFAVKMRELSVLTTELSAEMARELEALDYSPQMLEDTETRLDTIARITKKHGVEADGLAELAQSMALELEELDGADENIDELNARYAEARAGLLKSAQTLHDGRQRAADDIRTKIETQLHMLDMPSARFLVEITSSLGQSQTRFTKKGTDTVRFLLSTNSGEELRALSKVASGGELSRVMLAIKTVLSGGENGVTAVFDEIDAGVSGRAASHVGEKLYSISRTRQVLCVTHLPQIACLADYQYLIYKQDRGARTFTRVEMLDDDGRVLELARLTAGVHVTNATLESARTLLETAERAKKSLTSIT